jgi:uncharacterized protein YozE (UPF0346 family)
MTQRGPNESKAEVYLANKVDHDITFPKQSENYHEISSYLEMEVNYISDMTLFDEAWEKYLENNH